MACWDNGLMLRLNVQSSSKMEVILVVLPHCYLWKVANTTDHDSTG